MTRQTMGTGSVHHARWKQNGFKLKADATPRSALADQGTISGGSISRIVRNTLFYMCTNFGAFMQI